MFQGTSLQTREHRLVDGRRQLGGADDGPAAGASQRLVSGKGDDVGHAHRVGVDPTGDQAGHVGGIEEEEGADRIGDTPDRRRIDDPGVGGCPGDDELGPMLGGQGRQLVQIQSLVAVGDAIGHEVVEATTDVDRRPVGEVAALIESHPQNGVAGVEHGQVGGQVGRGAGMRLDVGVFGAKELAGPAPGQLFYFVDDVVTAVVALARIALGVLVGQHRSGRGHDRPGCEILRCDELQRGVLPLLLAPDDVEELAVLGHERSLERGRLAHRLSADPGARLPPLARSYLYWSTGPFLAHWPAVTVTRRRLGVALVLDPPVADAVDGLRRALGDPSLGRVPAHLTLVPPVNVRVDQFSAALARLRAAAASQSGPLRLTLGPPATFLPDNPVLYLEVGGEVPALQALRDHTFVAPLQRTLSWPWIPHVTISDMAETERIAAALVALDRFAVVATIEYLVLLQEQRDRIWSPIADAALGPPAVVGRGGLAVEITRGRLFDPEVIRMIQASGVGGVEGDRETAGWPDRPRSRIVLTARREAEVVGAGVAWRSDAGGQVAVVVSPGTRAQGIGGIVLAQLEAAVSAAGWDCPVLYAHGPAGFYRARSSWAVPEAPIRTGRTRTGPAS